MQIPLLTDIVIILGLSVAVLYLFQRIKIPTILGFLITGIIAGPYGLQLVNASHEVEVLSEIGVILLLFIIGMEFSLKSLIAIKNTVFIGGLVQVGLTILLVFLVAYSANFPSGKAIFLGFIISLSSTAIVLKVLQEKNEMSSPHGKIALAILIFQDIIVVPMMLFTPLIAGQAENVTYALLTLLLKAVLVIVAVIISARYLVPKALYEIAKTKSRELFILFVIVICFSVAWATSSIGLSLALGAFLAGLIISESEYSHQATGFVIPFRETFTSFFFVSIGMLLDLSFFFSHLGLILLLTVAAVVAKGTIALIAALALKYPLRTSLLTGLALFQIGEFSFILSKVGIEYGLLSADIYQYFLAISILSMGMTPFVMTSSDKIVGLLQKTSLRQKLSQMESRNTMHGSEDYLKTLKDHVIIIGYGINGRNVARAAKFANIPYVIIEMNAETVRIERVKGEPIYYGDAANEFLLEHFKVYTARVAVVAISDPAATRRIITNIRSICQTVYIIVRTRYVKEIDEFHRLGAEEVIPEEFETSIEIFTRLLRRYLIPQNDIEKFVLDIRSDNYEMLRPYSSGTARAMGVDIPDINITCLRTQQGDNEIVGKTIAESQLRSKYGVNLLAIQRNSGFITEIEANTKILQNDMLYIMGSPASIADLNNKIKV
jgi:monovalent cation:H+ antiporter-2, CPA2 family